VDELRRKIVRGQLKPGVRLPTRLELRDRFKVSLATVQEALSHLAGDGFVVARGKSGTTVAERPPHLFQYGFVTTQRPGGENWSLFPVGLCNAASSMEQTSSRRFRYYHGVNGAERNVEYLRLLGDVRANRLAGLIVMNAPEDSLQRTELAGDPPLPIVAICCETALEKVHLVMAHWQPFFERAVAHLAGMGRRRIAVIADDSMRAEALAFFREVLARHNCTTPACWLQVVHHTNPLSASQVARLLLHNKDDRPDGLILADDNIVEASLAGVLESGVRVPKELEITVYCNFPWTPKTPLPLKRFGYDARQTMEACVDLIDRLRQGQTAPRELRLQVLDGETQPFRMDH
jgi:DNA-binding LacI/PurR family transcriptional regulator